ncbi:hypothetical protein O181_124786 [Austropuccinia psidii MF-1]|uniref:Uncharacterized protein n=1 Tax=Austropuccinia psidii MF-1 TaxID=1389203 RepID=A0A9Q3KRV5_9BASI|nr:hypothetical protein [Austropuccinia psidii MF-1]
MLELPENIPLFILDSNESPSLFITHYSKWFVELRYFPTFEWDLLSQVLSREKASLGYDFLYHFNPIIDWKNGLITYHSTHKHSSGINSSTSNEFATAFNSVALFGELKTPSFHSSIHIPPINPSQSFLPLRDEVFKGIRYIGKDVAIYSLHLFPGDMDLPPLSFHASLCQPVTQNQSTSMTAKIP